MIDSIRKVLLPFALGLAPFAVAVAEDETRVSSSAKVEPSPASKSVVAGSRSHTKQSAPDGNQSVSEADLLSAVREGLVSVKAVGRGDGRMTLSLTNRSRRRCALSYPPE